MLDPDTDPWPTPGVEVDDQGIPYASNIVELMQVYTDQCVGLLRKHRWSFQTKQDNHNFLLNNGL